MTTTITLLCVLDWTATQSSPWQSFVVPPNQFESPEDIAAVYFEVFEEVERLENTKNTTFEDDETR
jgi:hypothetical protein